VRLVNLRVNIRYAFTLLGSNNYRLYLFYLLFLSPFLETGKLPAWVALAWI
jgi:hypothetical protein